MIQKGVVKTVPQSNLRLSDGFLKGYHHSVFLVPKKDTVVADMSPLTPLCEAMPFRMTGIRDLKAALSEGDHMAVFDLKSAYWHVPVHTD